VSDRRGTSKSGTTSGRGSVPRHYRAVWLSILCLVVLSFVPLGFGVVDSLPPTHLAAGLPSLSNLWMHFLAVQPWHLSRPQSATSRTTADQTVDRSWASVPVLQSGDGGAVWYGDRLKITIFESVGVALHDDATDSDQAVATVFPRMDLSADYAVDESGNVSMPRLGVFPVVGQTFADLQVALKTRFERTMGRTSDIQLAFVERQPIYVMGAVRGVGPYKHAPGMTVLQALAAAGGHDTAASDTSTAIENIRETQRLRQAEDHLSSLLLKRAMLIAQRDNSDTMQAPPEIAARLSQAAPEDGLNAMIAGAVAALESERKSYQLQLSLAQRQVDLARMEHAAQSLRADQLKELLGKKQAKLHEMEALAARGSVSQFKIIDMGVEVSDLLVHQEDLRIALTQAERGQVEAETALARLEADHVAEVEKSIAATQREISDLQRSIAAMRTVTQVLGGGLPGTVERSAAALDFKITRRLPSGLATIHADESTALLPGDVLEVVSSTRSGATSSGLAQNADHSQLPMEVTR